MSIHRADIHHAALIQATSPDQHCYALIPVLPNRRAVCFVIALFLLCSQAARAERSRIEGDHLILPRIEIAGFAPFALTFRIEFNEAYLLVLEQATAADTDSKISGRYDAATETLVVNEIELDNGEVYSATLHLVSQSPEVVFDLDDAELIYAALAVRSGVRPRTTPAVPHTQISVEPVPEVNAALFERSFSLPDVEQRESITSFAGTWGLWLADDLTLENPDIIVGGREFAHIHPDGSLHISLEPDRANDAVQARWAIFHPWADERDGWEGFVMLYTPRSMEDLDSVFQLIVDAYNYITGQKLQPADFH